MKRNICFHVKANVLIIFSLLSFNLFGQTFEVERLDGDPSTMTINDPIIDENTFMVSAGVNSNVSATSSLLNINGPSVIRVPDWIPEYAKTHKDANYYMYFGHHGGKSIRLAWAQYIDGPWHLFNYGFAPDQGWGFTGDYTGFYSPGDGVLDLSLGDNSSTLTINEDYTFGQHIASPDVVVDNVNERIIMYFHGYRYGVGTFIQETFVASSKFGLNFNIQTEGGEVGQGPFPVIPGFFYFRTFEIEGEANGQSIMQTFAFANRGDLYKAPSLTLGDAPALISNGEEEGGLWNPTDPLANPWWTRIPNSQNPLYQIEASLAIRPDGDLRRITGTSYDSPRHSAIYHDPVNDRDRIYLLYTGRGDAPESVVLVVFDLAGLTEEERLDPTKWTRRMNMEDLILEPEEDWEGADLDITYSAGGSAINRRQLRDPYVFKDTDGQLYLFYTGEGEEAIGVAKLHFTHTLPVTIKVFLQGAYETTDGMMNDGLRTASVIPSTEPYTTLGRTGIQNAGARVTDNMLSVEGNNALVDWVLVELRDATNNVIATRAGLVQRDGNIVEPDGIPMNFKGVAAGEYHIAVKHRNHLGVMTQTTVTID